jgi:hypothetical protein
MEKNQKATGITLSFRLSEAIHWTTKRIEKNACPTNPTDSQNCSLLIVPRVKEEVTARYTAYMYMTRSGGTPPEAREPGKVRRARSSEPAQVPEKWRAR